MLTRLFAALLIAAPAVAQEHGTLNPDELSMNRVLDDIRDGDTSMTNCAAGYLMTKSGRHAPARETFEACAEAGYTGAMTWMGQLDNNGLAGAYDPEAAAEWDRRAAEAGDPVGLFNLGLAYLRGHGVPQDGERGRALIDRAAEAGLEVARTLQAEDYDANAVTPDADEWKYQRIF